MFKRPLRGLSHCEGNMVQGDRGGQERREVGGADRTSLQAGRPPWMHFTPGFGLQFSKVTPGRHG